MLRATQPALIVLAAVALLAPGSPRSGFQAAQGTNTFVGSASAHEQYIFVPTGSPNRNHLYFDVGLVLDDGRFMATAQQAELYDPATDTWTLTEQPGNSGMEHTATLLSDGRVLIAGGGTGQLYDPATDTWTPTGSMVDDGWRPGATATLLQNGKVLFTGGIRFAPWPQPSEPSASAELYDPATNTWSPTGSMSRGRFRHAAALLSDGRVLVTGGADASAELYDPVTGAWSPTGSMHIAREAHTATLLGDGRVLVVGYGSELYDPATGAWTPLDGDHAAREDHTAVLLSDGRVLIAGGFPLAVELFDPATNTWGYAGMLAGRHEAGSAGQLHNGKILVVGGRDSQDPDGLPAIPAELGTWTASNTFTASLTLPRGWVTGASITVQFRGATSGAALEAGSLSRLATSSGWVKVGPDGTASTSLEMPQEGANQEVSLQLRDVNGQAVTAVTGMVSVDRTPPLSRMTPLSRSSTTRIALAWSGRDELSDVAGYDLQVREGSGAWADVLTNTMSTSMVYRGQVGRSYDFRVRARDVAGNVEGWPEASHTTTLVVTVDRGANPVYLPLISPRSPPRA